MGKYEINKELEKEALKKLDQLKNMIKELGSVAVAFSGGVDSTFLLKVAHDTLGDSAVAITAESPLFPHRESKEAEAFCQEQGIRQMKVSVDELVLDGFCQNPPNRCYLCKKDLFTRMKEIVEENHLGVLAEGSNLDDLGDYRPGLQAIKELEIRSPLRENGLSKAEIRFLLHKMGLPVWEKPSFACLASRFPYREQITAEKIKMVEQAEELLRQMGMYQFRVRIHGKMARIEVLPEDFEKVMKTEHREQIVEAFESFGFTYVTMDLKGYRTGSMNEIL